MPEDWLSTLLDESVRMGAAVSVILTGFTLGILFLVNLRWPMFISFRVHKERLDAEAKRADKAESDADGEAAQLRADLAERMTNFRADHADRMRQANEDHGRALEVLTKILESKDRDIESWRTAWNLSDQASREEDDARWDEIRAAMAVLQRFIQDGQRWAQQQRQLESGDVGGQARVG